MYVTNHVYLLNEKCKGKHSYIFVQTLFVVDEDNQVYLHVKVLDVDSVQQAKQKILDTVWRKGYCLQLRDPETLDLGEKKHIVSSYFGSQFE